MSQQLAINVINYSSTLVTSEYDADVECVYVAFSALPGSSHGGEKEKRPGKNKKEQI